MSNVAVRYRQIIQEKEIEIVKLQSYTKDQEAYIKKLEDDVKLLKDVNDKLKKANKPKTPPKPKGGTK